MAYTTSAEVAAPPEAVWRVLSDVESMPGWTSSMESVRIVDGPNPPGVGTAVRVEQPGMPLAVWTVDEWDPPRKFGWTSAVPGVRTQAEHVVEPAGEGRTRVTLTITQVGALAALIGALTRTRTRRLVDTELAGLTARAEAEAREA
ncbi:hypothetical protein GCM10028784_17880 [Myceligenerans cantabricum]